MNVGVLIIGMGSLSGAGGAERFFADLFDAYNSQENPKRELFFISDNLSPLHEIGRLTTYKEKQVVFKSYRYNFFHGFTKNRPRIDYWMNFIRAFFTRRSLLKQLQKYNIKALQLPVYEDKDFYLMKLLDNLPESKRPKLILNVTNAVVQNHYYDTSPRYAYHSRLNYGRLFENVKLDGVYTWYNAFRDFVVKERVIFSNPLVHSVSSRFTSTPFFEDFTSRQKKIIFSGRLSEYKDPLLFVKAAQATYKIFPGNGWKFEMYGKGALESEVRAYIQDNKLNDIITLSFSPDMPSVLRESMIYVSTQNAENFPSLAMAEAMACSNIIIARNVGQTDYYVKNGVNGFLMKSDTPEELAEILVKVMRAPEMIEKMGKESVSILKNVHNKENFINEIDVFWDSLNNRK